MKNNVLTVFKWVLALGTLIGLLLLYRTVPLIGDGALEGLTRFNIATVIMGAVCLLVFIFAMRRWKKSGRELGVFEKGANAVLIAIALITLELGIWGLVGVNMDAHSDPQIASMKHCTIEETSVTNRLRGIDSILKGTDPSGKERIFPIDSAAAKQIGSAEQDLTVEYYDMTNRVIRIS